MTRIDSLQLPGRLVGAGLSSGVQQSLCTIAMLIAGASDTVGDAEVTCRHSPCMQGKGVTASSLLHALLLGCRFFLQHCRVPFQIRL
jgi:hypothetical protein